MSDSLPVSEIFTSLQGEGWGAGLPTLFIRLAGCNLAIEHGGCLYCDTRYAQKPEQGGEMTFDEIFEKVPRDYPGVICVTGGEPLSHGGIIKFLNRLSDSVGGWISVETNGSIPIPKMSRDGGLVEIAVYSSLAWSVDIKCPGSGMEEFNYYENIERLHHSDQLKFVIADRKDFDFAKQIMKTYRRCLGRIVFQPAYKLLDPAELAKWILEDKLSVKLSLQLQKILWGTKRGV